MIKTIRFLDGSDFYGYIEFQLNLILSFELSLTSNDWWIHFRLRLFGVMLGLSCRNFLYQPSTPTLNAGR